MTISLKPQCKILYINVHPGSFPFALMVPLTFEDQNNTDYWDMSMISSPPKESEPKLVRREDRSHLPLPDSVDDYVGVIITGSSFAAHPRKRDDGTYYLVRWKREFFAWIRMAQSHGIPMLGICSGEQHIGEALGGKVVKMGTRREKGWNRIALLPDGKDDPVLRHLPTQFVAAQNHGDTVDVLPDGAQLLAYNEFGVQAFRIDNSIGVEFHPERNPEQVEELLEEVTEPEKFETQTGMTVEANRQIGLDYDPVVKRIFSRFLCEAWNRQ